MASAAERHTFPELARRAVADTQLRRNIGNATQTIRAKRAAVVAEVPDWEELREGGRSLKEHTLRNLDRYLVQLEESVTKAGGQVLFGTDVGYMTDYDPAEEYRLLARALAPMEILASLTTAPAARWKEGEVRGRVLQGQVADLVVLNADPAADAANFANVRCTLRAGNPTYTAPVGVR